ncbi:MAG: tyrosine-type recombinase/integrase, partial [Candidatus Hydrothermarchaeota archaeon]
MAEIYSIKRQYEYRVRSIREDEKITPRNKELILEFERDLFSEGLTLQRVLFYLNRLHMIARWIEKDLDKLDKKDVKNLVARIERSDYSEWTKKDYNVTIKKFYKWLNGGEEYPEQVKWIRTTMKKDRQKLPEDLLTEEEVKKLIESAENIRDKTMISVLYEGGLRIGELLDTKIKHVSFDRHGASILV